MLDSWVEKMNKVETAGERRAVVEELGRLRGWKTGRVYSELAKAGWESGRRPRSDAGTSSLSPEALSRIAALIKEGIRKNGKAVMTVPVARSILEANGYDVDLSDSRIRVLLREAKMDRESMQKPTPAQSLRSEHPNHVHQVDPSRALLYYSPDGRQHIIRDDEAYKNKLPEAWKKTQLWRYVLTDHYSSSLCVRYYESDGEKQDNMWDFLLYAWRPKADPLYAFHGRPKFLYWDAGSANTAKAIQRGLRSLGVENQPHMPGNPRAKGQVERANNLVELYLESRLRIEPVNNVEELNDLADRFCAAFNANRIPGIETVLMRNKQRVGVRLVLWQRIKPEELRELPDEETCRLLLTPEPETRTVDGRLMVSYSHPKAGRSRLYPLSHLPGLSVGMEVEVQPLLYGDAPTLLVRYKISRHDWNAAEVLPMETDEAGFDVAAATLGISYKRPKETEEERNVKELAKRAYGEAEPGKNFRPFAAENDGDGLAAHSFIGSDRPDILPARRVGRMVEVTMADVILPYEVRKSPAEACIAVKARLGWLPAGFMDRIKEEYPEGMLPEEIEEKVTALKQLSAAKIREA